MQLDAHSHIVYLQSAAYKGTLVTNQLQSNATWPGASDVPMTNYGQRGIEAAGAKLNPPTACFANHAKSQVGFYRTNPGSDTHAGLCWLTLNLVHSRTSI